ncbi:MAG: hypothetical protein Fur0041_23080 [Bacteroidia bacterium]
MHAYDLSEIEDLYRKYAAKDDQESFQKMQSILNAIRYDLRMDIPVQLEYREGLDEPMVMRKLSNERDLERWIDQRFIRFREDSQ